MKNAVLNILNTGTPSQIKALFLFNRETPPEMIKAKFLYWSRYFFPKFFPSKDAPFHKDIDEGNISVYIGKEKSFLDIASRDSSKTTRTKLFVAFCVANDEEHYRRYFKVLSKDPDNAKQFVTDVYNRLVSPRIKALYPEIFEKTEAKREETMASFTTAAAVKVTSDTVGTDQRGDVQDETRPDFIIYDDFETRKSLMSAVVTKSVWLNMEEARKGLSKDGGAVYLCNYISERGNVHKLVGIIDNKIIIPIAIKGPDGKWIPSWPDRYTPKDIEKIEADCKKTPDGDFEGEYLCKPSASKDVYFDRESVDRQNAKEVIDEIASLKIWRKYNPSNRVGSGHDVGGGVGLDSSTSVFIDFDCIPAQVIATYKNNEIKPDAFAYEIARQCKRFGENYCGVEKNYGSTLDILKGIYPTAKIHKTYKNDVKIVFQNPTEYGWDTNGNTKNTMVAEGAKAVEDGLVELNDPDLIAEARSYTTGDLMDREVDPRLTTRHFDLLMAFCIAWQMNVFIKKPTNKAEPDPWAARREQEKAKNPAR